VSDLLRQALVIASKLGLSDFEAWVRLELNGYPPDGKLPPYRTVTGFPLAENPVLGWVPVGADDPASISRISHAKVTSSVTHLEALLRDNSGDIAFQWPARLASQFARQNFGLTNPVTKVSRGSISAILEAARNEILDWALKLDAAGIKGEGLEFTEREKSVVQAKQHVSNYYGPTNVAHIAASGDHATVNVSFGAGDIAAIAELAKSLHEISFQLGLQGDDLAEMKAEVAVLEAQVTSPRPKSTMLKSALAAVVRILGAAAVKEAAGPLMRRAAELLQRLG
jgi:hypothetical protein